MKTKIIQNIKSIILALILVLGVSYVSAFSTWVNPTSTPPNNNADTPLNVGNTGQIKVGGLTLNTGGAPNGLIVQSGKVGIGVASPAQKLDVAGTIQATGLKITTGATAGKVLTSDALGVATWQAAAAGSGDNLGNHVATQALNMNNNVITRQASGDFNTVELQSGSDRISFDNGSYNGETVFAALINEGPYPIQRRGSLNCPAGQAIRTIGVNGSATCVDVGATTTSVTLTNCEWTAWEYNATGANVKGAGLGPTYCPAGKIASGFDLDGSSNNDNESVFQRMYCCSMSFQ
ncbi:MAG: hypothetical protein WC694_02835 [Candidatus Paceibacterota bacterium]|jgi:hypothetical protein